MTDAASAQEWLENRARAEGPGIRVGNLELHPGVGAEIGYDSNVFNSAPDQNPLGSAILRVTPHFYLSTLTRQRREEGEDRAEPQTVTFRTGVYAAYYEYFEERPPDNLGLGALLNLNIKPSQIFALGVNGDYRRVVRPFTEDAPGADYVLNRGQGGLNLRFSTPGDALGVDVGYQLPFRIFEGEDFRFGNRISHRGRAGVTWKFLPQTALFYEGSGEYVDYLDIDAARPGSSLVSDGVLTVQEIGVNGVLTNALSFLISAGYAAIFFNDNRLEETDTLVARAELRWRTSPTTSLTLGYVRDLQPSWVGGYIQRDVGNVRAELLLLRVLLLGVQANIGGQRFGTMVDANGNPLGADGSTSRNDIRAGASVFSEYRITDWLGINVTLGYSGVISDFEFARVVGAGPVPDPAQFNKFEAFFGVRAFY